MGHGFLKASEVVLLISRAPDFLLGLAHMFGSHRPKIQGYQMQSELFLLNNGNKRNRLNKLKCLLFLYYEKNCETI